MDPVSHTDLFPTILGIFGAKDHASDGNDLRPLLNGQGKKGESYVVSEWDKNGPKQPGLMVRTMRWKLFIPNAANSKVMNVLYDLQEDPHELNNLLGNNPDREDYVSKANELKDLLVEWLVKTDSPYVEEVKKRKM